MTTPLNREKEIFEQAIEIESQVERNGFIKGACGENSTLAERIHTLLGAHKAEEEFLPDKSDEEPTLLDESPITEGVGSIIGRYKLLEKIGEGGFGFVWAAEQKEPVRRRVALKIIKLGMDTKQVVARFEAECQALAMMEDPNISKMLDAGATDTGRPYFVMELVKGIPITAYCNQEKLSTRARLDLFIKVCRAIQHAHQKGIIHRDIKPSNIMITLHDGVPVPKVIDFGIAKATQQELTDKTIYTQYSQFIGTPAYMSPEQAEMSGLDVDTRSDIYSLGVLLYELLTGSTPFETKDLMQSGIDEMRKIIREKEPERPSSRLTQTLASSGRDASSPSSLRHLPSTIESDLDWIIMKCLEKDRSRRYDTANGLASDLKRHLNNEPVIARPPTAAYKFLKAWRRNKVAYTAGVAIAVALVLGVIGTTFGLQRAKEQTKAAEEAEKKQAEQRLAAVAARDEARILQRKEEADRNSSLINIAAGSLVQSNLNTAQQALLLILPEYRKNWEWRHLADEAWPPPIDLDPRTIRKRKSVQSVSEFWDGAIVKNIASMRIEDSRLVELNGFSHDGSQVVAASASKSGFVVYNYDALTGEDRYSYEVDNSSILRFGLMQDDSRLVTGDMSGDTEMWDVLTRERIWTHQYSYANSESSSAKPIDALWFNPDNTTIAVAYFNGDFGGVIDVLESETGQRIAHFSGHPNVVTSLKFLPDHHILSASLDGSVRVWDLETETETMKTQSAPLHTDKGISFQAISPGPDYKYVASGDYDGTVILWNRLSGEILKEFEGASEIIDLIFSDDGSCLFVVEGGKRITVWDTALLRKLTFIDSPDPFISVALSPGGDRLMTTSMTGKSRIWASRQVDRDPITLSKAHDDIVIQAAFSNKGNQISTASYDGTSKIWDAASQELIKTFRKHTNEVLSANFSLNGNLVVSFCSYGNARVWDSRTGNQILSQEVASPRFSQSASPGRGLRGFFLEWAAGFSSNPFSPTEQKLVVNNGLEMLVINPVDGRKLFSLPGSSVGWPVISPSGDLVAILTDTHNYIDVWDMKTGQQEPIRLSGHNEQAFWADFSPDSKRIVTGSMDRTAIVFDAASGTQIHRLEDHQGWVTIARFSPGGRWIATASSDKTAKIWDATTGNLLSTLQVKGDSQRVNNVAFNPNDAIPRIFTTALDNIVRIWDHEGPEAHEVLQITRDSKLTYATWSPDGRRILTCWKDGVVRLYNSLPQAGFDEITDSREMAVRIKEWRATAKN